MSFLPVSKFPATCLGHVHLIKYNQQQCDYLQNKNNEGRRFYYTFPQKDPFQALSN